MFFERYFLWKGSVEVNSVILLNFSKVFLLKFFFVNYLFRLKVVILCVFLCMNILYYVCIVLRFKYVLVKESDEY